MACTSLVQLRFSFPAMLLPVAVPEERQFLPRNSDTRNHIQMEAVRSSFEVAANLGASVRIAMAGDTVVA